MGNHHHFDSERVRSFRIKAEKPRLEGGVDAFQPGHGSKEGFDLRGNGEAEFFVRSGIEVDAINDAGRDDFLCV